MKLNRILIITGPLALSVGTLFSVALHPKHAVRADAKINTGMIYIGDQDVVAGTIQGGEGTASYSNGKVTLNNYTYTGYGHHRDDEGQYAGIWAYVQDNHVTFEIKGTNTITVLDDDNQLHQAAGADMYAFQKNITFTGDGVLNLIVQENPNKVPKYSYGLNADCDVLNINGPTINLVAARAQYGSYGFHSDYSNNVKVSSGILKGTGGEITSSGYSSGLSIDDLTMTGGRIEGLGGKTDEVSAGIIFSGNDDSRKITGGSIEGVGGVSTANQSYGIYTSTDNLSLEIGENIDTVLAVGNNIGISPKFLVKNSVKGLGFISAVSEENPVEIPIAPEGQNITGSYRKVQIGKLSNSFTVEPVAKEGLVANGSEQELCEAGEAIGGKVLYKVGGGEYSESLPKKAEAGTYTVYYKVDGSPIYKDIDEKSFEVTIAEAPAPVDPETPDSPKKNGGKLGAGAIVGIVLGGLVILLCGAWVLLMFVLNKWIKVGDKVVRAFKLFGIKKDGKPLVWGFPFKFVTREESEIFKTKEDALK